MSTRAQKQTISHPVISLFQSDFDRYSCKRLCLFRKEPSQEDTEQAGKCRSSFPMLICVDNKPLAGFHNKRQAISPGIYSLCMSKDTFLRLLLVPQILPTACSFPGLHLPVSGTWKGELRNTPLLSHDSMVVPSPNFSCSTWIKANPSAEPTFSCKPQMPPGETGAGQRGWMGEMVVGPPGAVSWSQRVPQQEAGRVKGSGSS